MSFVVNDKIVHNTGVGKIEAIEPKTIAGSALLCYKIYLYTKPDVALFIPVVSKVQMRKLADRRSVEEFFMKLRQPELLPTPKNVHWKKTVRLHSEMIHSRNFIERGDAYVYLRHRERISPTEETLLHEVEDLLIYEITLITNKLSQVVRQELDSAVLESRNGIKQEQKAEFAA